MCQNNLHFINNQVHSLQLQASPSSKNKTNSNPTTPKAGKVFKSFKQGTADVGKKMVFVGIRRMGKARHMLLA